MMYWKLEKIVSGEEKTGVRMRTQRYRRAGMILTGHDARAGCDAMRDDARRDETTASASAGWLGVYELAAGEGRHRLGAEERERERTLEKKRASRFVCSALAWSRTGQVRTHGSGSEGR